MATAVVSLASGLKVKPDVAMTGEISLRGLVLPVGGLKEKLLAAKRAGLSTVLVPARNRPDIQELPPAVTEGLEIVEVETLDQALERALMTPERIFGGEAFKPSALPEDGGPLAPRLWPPASPPSSPSIMAAAESPAERLAAA